MLSVEPFLTAYDPSDLPGASIDPLGFDRGYQYLAEAILPGLTNVANRPRYWSVLCAALVISDDRAPAAETLKQRSARRRSAVQRLERFWALACVRASQKSDGELPEGGIRGLRYVQREISRQGEKADRTDGEYKLLARQLQYGLLGIYSSVAERLHLVGHDLGLHSEFGMQLGQAFIEETRLPGELRKAVVEGGEIRLAELVRWGERAHHSVAIQGREGTTLRRAFDLHDVRRRMGVQLQQHPADANTSELDRLDAIRLSVANDEVNRDLHDALAAILPYERCFQALSLGFYRLLWLVRQSSQIGLDIAGQDRAVRLAWESARSHVESLDRALTGSTSLLHGGAARWGDALSFTKAAAQSPTAGAFVLCLLSRHREVQHGKFDRGVRKTPWLEPRNSSVHLTLSQAQRVGREPETPDRMDEHGYRTAAADRLLGGLV